MLLISQPQLCNLCSWEIRVHVLWCQPFSIDNTLTFGNHGNLKKSISKSSIRWFHLPYLFSVVCIGWMSVQLIAEGPFVVLPINYNYLLYFLCFSFVKLSRIEIQGQSTHWKQSCSIYYIYIMFCVYIHLTVWLSWFSWLASFCFALLSFD